MFSFFIFRLIKVSFPADEEKQKEKEIPSLSLSNAFLFPLFHHPFPLTLTKFLLIAPMCAIKVGLIIHRRRKKKGEKQEENDDNGNEDKGKDNDNTKEKEEKEDEDDTTRPLLFEGKNPKDLERLESFVVRGHNTNVRISLQHVPITTLTSGGKGASKDLLLFELSKNVVNRRPLIPFQNSKEKDFFIIRGLKENRDLKVYVGIRNGKDKTKQAGLNVKSKKKPKHPPSPPPQMQMSTQTQTQTQTQTPKGFLFSPLSLLANHKREKRGTRKQIQYRLTQMILPSSLFLK